METTYNTIDDNQPTVSTKAEGKPKVLFIGTENEETRESLASIAADLPKGIDFYYIDYAGRGEEEIFNFKNSNTPNSEGIVYCYGSDNQWNNGFGLAMTYLQAAGFDPSKIQTPVVCYIDENNYLQQSLTLDFPKVAGLV